MDEVFINPAPEQVGDTLARAVVAANARTTAAKKAGLSKEAVAELLAQAWAEADGEQLFPGQANGRRGVGVAWWVDPGRRRHVRVWVYHEDRGDEEYDEFAEFRGDDDEEAEEPAAAVPGPPCCRVYPGSLFAVRAGDGPEVVLAACGCGNVGSPNALGWSGDRCGPCADARDEGRDGPCPAIVYGVTGGQPAHMPPAIRFTPDGSGLVTQLATPALVRIDLRTNRRTVAPSLKGVKHLFGVAFAADGRTLLATHGGNKLVRWDMAANTATLVGGNECYADLVLSPDGRHAVRYEYELLALDPADAKRPIRRRKTNWSDSFYAGGGGFNRAGTEWTALMAHDGQFARADLATTEVTVIREDALAGLPEESTRYGLIILLALDPDHDRAVIASDSEDYGTYGPAYLGPVRGLGPWRPIPYNDGTEHNLPAVYGFTPDGAWVLHSATGGGLAFYPADADDRRPAVVVAGLTGTGRVVPTSVAFSPDGETLACQVAAITGLWILPWKRMLAAVGVTA